MRNLTSIETVFVTGGYSGFTWPVIDIPPVVCPAPPPYNPGGGGTQPIEPPPPRQMY